MVSHNKTTIDTNAKRHLSDAMLSQAHVFHLHGNHHVAGWLAGESLKMTLVAAVQRVAERRLAALWDVAHMVDFLVEAEMIDQAGVGEIKTYAELAKDCETNARRLPLYSAFPVTVDQVAEMLAGVEALQTRLLPEGDAATDGM